MAKHSLLSRTDKMNCPGFNLPFGRGCPAMQTSLELARQQGGEPVCGRCYANQGRYKWRSVKESMERRWDWWTSTDPIMRARLLASFVKAEGESCYFRAYDSGDLDLGAEPTWLQLAELLPNTKIWIPTRTWLLPDYLPMLRRLNAHPRIIVRPSAICFGDLPPMVEGLSAGITAPKKGQPKEAVAEWACPGGCGDCRVCWDNPETTVAYDYK